MTSSTSSGSHLISDFQWDFIDRPRDFADRVYHSKIIDFYQQNKDAERFAYVDETYQPPAVNASTGEVYQGFYSMTAVIIEADQVKNFRDALTNLDFPEQKFHAVNNSDGYNKQFLDFINPHLVQGATVITVGTAVDYSSREEIQKDLVREARHSSLLSLIQQSQNRENPVYAFVFERMKDNEENKMDVAAISNFTQAGLIKHIDQIQVSPSAERLLWAPDVVCYSVQKVLNYSNFTLYDTVKDNVEVYDALSQKPLDLSSGSQDLTSSLNLHAAKVSISELPDNALMQVAAGRFIREEVIVSLSEKGSSGRVLQPERQQGIAYARTQRQGHHHELSPRQAVVQSIARGDMTPRQKQAFEELNRRGTPIPSALQAVKTSYERMERAREAVFRPRNRDQQNQRSQNHGQQQQQNNQQQRNRHQERRRGRDQRQSHQNQRRNGPRR